MTKRKPIFLMTDSEESRKTKKMLEENKILCDVCRSTYTFPILLVFDDPSVIYKGMYQGFAQIEHYVNKIICK